MTLSEGQLWLVIGALALITAALKAAGPALVGGRDLPRWANGVIAAWVKHHPDAALADLHAQTCSAGYRSVINGVSLYEDTLHFTPRGAAMIWTWLAPQVQRAGAAR